MSGSASWSGKLCVRCGTARTSNVSNGEPVCSPCLARARAEAATATDPGKPAAAAAGQQPAAGAAVGEGLATAASSVLDAVFTSLLL
ncbi:MAG: hypothetical protein ACK5AL_09590 [Planctomycetota bacterium]